MAKKQAAISADERRWQRESDARTLKEYAQIQGDPSRLRAARGQLRDEGRAIQRAIGKIPASAFKRK
jgi:hypothetical protein